MTYKTESYACMHNHALYPDSTYLPFAGCTGGPTTDSTFETLPTLPRPTLQTYTFTTSPSFITGTRLLNYPLIYPLGQLLVGDSLTVKIGVPNHTVDTLTMDRYGLKLLRGTSIATGSSPTSSTCNGSNQVLCRAEWNVSETNNYYLEVSFLNSDFILSKFQHFQIYAASNISGGGAVLLQHTAVYSQKLVKYFYLSQTSDFTASLETVSGGVLTSGVQDLQVYGVAHNSVYPNMFDTAPESTSSQLTSTSPAIIGAKELPAGYYILRVTYAADVESVTVKWGTNSYQCFHHAVFTDFQ